MARPDSEHTVLNPVTFSSAGIFAYTSAGGGAGLCARSGEPRAGFGCRESSAELLAAAGVPTLPAVALKTASLDEDVELPFGFPVVVKALSNQLAHKTDAGGVVLGVTDLDGLREAVRTIVDTVAVKAGVVVDRVLV
jgi:hypothetical protein